MDKCVDHSCNRKAECFHCSLVIVHTERGCSMHLPHSKNGNLTEVSVTEMPTSDTVFQEFLEINAYAHAVDIRCSFLPSPFSAPNLFVWKACQLCYVVSMDSTLCVVENAGIVGKPKQATACKFGVEKH